MPKESQAHPLWTPDIERSVLNESMFATIYCPNCQYTEKAVFRGKSPKCPRCRIGKLSVSEFNQRNAIVADATERFAVALFDDVVQHSPDLHGKFFVKRNVVCRQLELYGQSKADMAILDQNLDTPVSPNRIKCIFEIKMSIIWNWSEDNRDKPLSDYDSHAGRPSIYRTDSILKAIGKAAVTRSCSGSERIPFIVVGNTPPPPGYRDKVDGTVKAGLIQQWISLTPSPLAVQTGDPAQERNPKHTLGFQRLDDTRELEQLLLNMLTRNWRYMGAMVEAEQIGQVIKSLDLSKTPEEIGEAFLQRMASPNLR